MKIRIISYSLTGNNEALASAISDKLKVQHITVEEKKKRTIATTALDMLFNRKPKIEPENVSADNNDLLIFMAPIWMGKVASPLRGIFKNLKRKSGHYAFVTISGGADGPNTGIEKDLVWRLKRKPDLIIDELIVDLFPKDSKPTRDQISTYRLSADDIEKITKRVTDRIGKLKLNRSDK